jgi:hypothetical protein
MISEKIVEYLNRDDPVHLQSQQRSKKESQKNPGCPSPASDLSTPALDSMVLSAFREIFAEFRGGESFKLSDFHERCGGRAHTLILIEGQDTKVFVLDVK